MPDTGTGTDPTTDRCPDCGHPLDAECGCLCCDPFMVVLWAWIGRARRAQAAIDDITGRES